MHRRAGGGRSRPTPPSPAAAGAVAKESASRQRSDDAVANWRFVCLLTLGAFLGLGLAAFATGVLPGDLALREELLQPDGGLAHRLARIGNEAGTWRVLLPATLLLFLSFRAARRRWWLWSALMVLSSLIEHGVKLMVGRPRPSGFSFGFPSGHTTAAATFAVILIYVASREPSSPASRLLIQVLAVLAMALVGWARIVLHAHWPTDVLGGFLLGAGCAAAGAWWDSVRLEAAAADRA
jgi:undecaprenyl-diphosphatase